MRPNERWNSLLERSRNDSGSNTAEEDSQTSTFNSRAMGASINEENPSRMKGCRNDSSRSSGKQATLVWTISERQSTPDEIAVSSRPSVDESANSSQETDEVKQLLEIKSNYEIEIETHTEQNRRLKDIILELRGENADLKRHLEGLQLRDQKKVIKELEDEVSKWETLYFETAQVGEAKMKRLEKELQELRSSSQSNQHVAETTRSHMDKICDALAANFEAMQSKQKEFDEYKRKSNERILMLTDMLEYKEAEREKELEQLKRKQVVEYDLMEKVEDLEAEVRAKSAIIERERNQAAKRESRLRDQIKKAKESNSTPREPPESAGAFEGACSSVAKALEDSLYWCAPRPREWNFVAPEMTSAAPE